MKEIVYEEKGFFMFLYCNSSEVQVLDLCRRLVHHEDHVTVETSPSGTSPSESSVFSFASLCITNHTIA